MTSNILYTWVLALCMTVSGCGDFLEEYSRDQVYASSWKDLDEVLIGNGYIENDIQANLPNRYGDLYYPFLFLMDDDAEELLTAARDKNPGVVVQLGRAAATWQRDPFRRSVIDEERKDNTITKLYEHIAYTSTIINYVDEFPKDPIEELMRIQGEGQFLRAAYYLMVNNIYGWAYDPKNDGADWGVQLKTSEWIVEEHIPRGTVKQVYRAIVGDLEGACENLRGVVQKNFYRTNQLAAHILLSRVHLYMENYDKVIVQCDSALAMGCPLSDLNTYVTGNVPKERTYLYSNNNPEIVFTMGYGFVQEYFKPEDQGGGAYTASAGLMAEFRDDAEVKDLRLDCYFRRHKTASDRFGVCKAAFKTSGTNYPTVFETFLIRTVEAYLNKAEAQAMKGDLAGAVTTLQPLLETRYAPGMLPRLSGLGEAELVNFVRSERRRELCFEGHRWPDLKRYAVSTKYPYNEPIQHAIYTPRDQLGGDLLGYYELGRYGEDDGWIMPLPASEITYNEGDVVNPERPERELK